MAIDYETILAAQRAKMDFLHWFSKEIDRHFQLKAAKLKAEQQTLKREAEGRPKRKP